MSSDRSFACSQDHLRITQLWFGLKISAGSADYFSHPATLFLESPKKREPLRSNPRVDPRRPLSDLPKCDAKRRKILETSFNSFEWRTLHYNSLIINNLAETVKTQPI
jgi:hypothetical protein